MNIYPNYIIYIHYIVLFHYYCFYFSLLFSLPYANSKHVFDSHGKLLSMIVNKLSHALLMKIQRIDHPSEIPVANC